MAYASGYFKTGYAVELRLVETRLQWTSLAALLVLLAAFPFVAPAFVIGIANQVFLAIVGAAALMLLMGYAGQISLGHAGLLAAGALSTGILFKETGAAFWVTLPASAAGGALLGGVFGRPALREPHRDPSTLARQLHFGGTVSLVFPAACARCAGHPVLPEPAAQPHRARPHCDPRP